jgi:hypothetical protein
MSAINNIQSGQAAVNGTVIEYETAGAGQPIVFVDAKAPDQRIKAPDQRAKASDTYAKPIDQSSSTGNAYAKAPDIR